MMRMEKPTTKMVKVVAKESAAPLAPAPPADVAKDVEAFAHNVARIVEEGGKALAAYIKPREEGKIKSDTPDQIVDVVKTIGQVAEYWLSDPQRAVEVQANLGRAYLDLWA
ncbi:MAG: class I poly(R)-hydroxyalkanoic acid synthase, partial [Pseudolabrys sp.]|nr:class I poly(R)-hydroxyalkanoic acid synthase [Pseudolabrys sp.]